jgi:hypothetical protein
MSITNISRGGDDFRAAAGLASWSPAALDLAPETAPAPRGPGLFEVIGANGQRMVTNVRRLAGAERTPGSGLILAASVLLGMLAAGLFVVSLSAQYRYVFMVKHQSVPSAIEAVGLDVGMAVFSLLALGLAMAGQSARIERALIVVCAVASAGQNYAAADVTSPRSVAAYVLPPLFLALVVDRVVAVVRRHVLGGEERSVWAAAGRGLGAAAKGLGLVLLYLLRFVLAPPSTGLGLRRLVLIAAPLPAAEQPERHDDDEDQGDDETREPAELEGATKKARLTWWYERDASYGDRGAVAAAAARIAPKVGLGEGTARAYIGAIVADLEHAGAAS